jgi:hypothetical protein
LGSVIKIDPGNPFAIFVRHAGAVGDRSICLNYAF